MIDTQNTQRSKMKKWKKRDWGKKEDSSVRTWWSQGGIKEKKLYEDEKGKKESRDK